MPHARARSSPTPSAAEGGADAHAYVDEARTHHIDARIVKDASGMRFVVVESPHGAHDASERHESVSHILGRWEAWVQRAELEARLAALGSYWRWDGRGWAPLHPGPLTPRVDLRPIEAEGSGGAVTLHAFHHGGNAMDRLLVIQRRSTPRGDRYRLASVEFRHGDPEGGEVTLLHGNLTEGTLRSLLAREHVHAAWGGHEKLLRPQDMDLVYGTEWRRRLVGDLDARLEAAKPEPSDPSKRYRMKEAPPPVGGVTRDLLRLLDDGRLAAVHARFMVSGEEEALLVEGPQAIERAIQGKRKYAPHNAQHILSVLEASLLVRHSLKRAEGVDLELVGKLRRLCFYL